MARTSAYSTILSSLNIPSSVFGGQYGDISNRLNERDAKFESLQNQELLNDSNSIKLENQKRQEEYDKSLEDIFQSERPKTMRDLYEAQLGKAIETGNGDMAAELQKGILQYEENEREKRIKDFSNAAGLADNITPEILLSQYPDFPKSEAARIFAKSQRGKIAKEDTFPMINEKTGEIDPKVSYSDAMKKQKDGWRFTRIGQYDPLQQAISEISGGNPQAPAQTPWYLPFSPTGDGPVAQARGDRARQQPAPGDEVRVITRKRTAEVGRAPRG